MQGEDDVRPGAVLVLFALVTAGCVSWPTYHGDNLRTGDAGTAPNLVAPRVALASPVLDGDIYGEPVVLGSRVLVATENNSLYALDLGDGHVVWGPTHIGTPVPQSWLQCGDIFPLGITGTPVVDAWQRRRVPNLP